MVRFREVAAAVVNINHRCECARVRQLWDRVEGGGQLNPARAPGQSNELGEAKDGKWSGQDSMMLSVSSCQDGGA